MNVTHGHRLIQKPLLNGRTSWTCECGEWSPNSSSAPFWKADMMTVINYIKREHAKHAEEAKTIGQIEPSNA